MNKLISFEIFIILIGLTIANKADIEKLPNQSLGASRNVARLPQSDGTDCTGKYASLCKDCNTFMQCIGLPDPVKVQKCPSEAPFCKNGKCSTTAAESVNGKDCIISVTTVCTAEGFFPDPKDCSRYNYCENPGSKPVVYECPIGFVFNIANQNCKKKASPSDCNTIECTAMQDNQYVLYKPNNAYYAFCENVDGKKRVILFKCLDDVNFAFDLTKFGCEYKCAMEGIFPDPLDCSGYYICFRNGHLTQYVHVFCPTNYIYDNEKCVKKIKSVNCLN